MVSVGVLWAQLPRLRLHGDETLLISQETPSFSLLAMLAKLMILNVIKLSMKLPLRLGNAGSGQSKSF